MTQRIYYQKIQNRPSPSPPSTYTSTSSPPILHFSYPFYSPFPFAVQMGRLLSVMFLYPNE